jgi:hypothetical protein
MLCMVDIVVPISRCLFERENLPVESSNRPLMRGDVGGKQSRETESGLGERTTMFGGLVGGAPCGVSL